MQSEVYDLIQTTPQGQSTRKHWWAAHRKNNSCSTPGVKSHLLFSPNAICDACDAISHTKQQRIIRQMPLIIIPLMHAALQQLQRCAIAILSSMSHKSSPAPVIVLHPTGPARNFRISYQLVMVVTPACRVCRPHPVLFSRGIEDVDVPAQGSGREMGCRAENTQSYYSGWMFPIKQLNQPPNDSFHRHLGNYRSLLFTSGDETAWAQPGEGGRRGGGGVEGGKDEWEVNEWKQRDWSAESEDGVEDVENLN